MTVLKQYNTGTSTWETVVVGQPGEAGIVNGTVAPADTSVLWLDTADTASQVAVPSGGTAGQVLAKTSNTDYATGWVDSPGHNYILNGAMDVWQRGNSHTITTSAFYTADRWYASGSGGSTSCTISKQTSGSPVGIGSHARMTYNTNSAFCNVFQALESADVARLAGKTVTISFKARRNASYVNGINFTISTGTVADSLTAGTWTEIASASISNSQLPTGTSSSDWFTKSATVVIPANAIALRFRIGEDSTQPAGAYIEYTGFKIEDGSVATPFKRNSPSIQAELAACQRYYYRQSASATYSRFGGVYGVAYASNAITMPFNLPVKMRVSPYSIDYGGAFRVYDTISSLGSVSSIVIVGSTEVSETPWLVVVSSGLTQYRSYSLNASGDASAYIGFSAEL